MVPNSFIQFRKGATDIIFNPAHIISVERRNIELTDRNRDEYAAYPTSKDKAYTIFLELTRGSMEYVYPSVEVRDAMFQKISETLGPFVLSIKMNAQTLVEAETAIQ